METTFVALLQSDHRNYPSILDLFLQNSEPGDELILTDCSASADSNKKLRAYQLGPYNIRSVLHFEPVSEKVGLRTALRARQFENVRMISRPEGQIEGKIETVVLPNVRSKPKEIDLLFVPHNKYHTHTSSMLVSKLAELGVRAGILNITQHIKDEGVDETASELGIELYRLEDVIDGDIMPRGLVVFNDWEVVSRTVLASAQAHGVKTIAIVEGIQDYDDVDTGRERHAYKMCKKVILPGAFDQRYFTDRQETVFGGIPRLHGLVERPDRAPPSEKAAAINVNFTYGVLEHKRDEWLQGVVTACDEVGFTPIITRHPADRGKRFRELESEKAAYDLIEDSSVLITRFSTLVLEALVLNRPVIYYNPHCEKVDKFLEPMGAYQIANSFDELKIALGRLLEDPLPPEDSKIAFLKEHAHFGQSDHETVPSILCGFVDSWRGENPEFDAFRETLRKIDVSTRCYSNQLPLKRISARYAS